MTTESPVTVDLERANEIALERLRGDLNANRYGAYRAEDVSVLVEMIDNLRGENRRLARLGELDVERLRQAMRAVLDTTTRERVLPYADKLAAAYATALQESHDAD